MNFTEEMIKYGSFPKGERPEPYQEYYLNGSWQKGQRDIIKRTELMKFNPTKGDIILEIGCQTGGFLQYAWLKGSRNIYGIDIDKDYLRLARELNNRNGFGINYLNYDITDNNFSEVLKPFINIDYLLLMSMGKHISEKRLFEIIDYLKPKTVYIETNAVNNKNPYPHLNEIKKRNGVVLSRTYDRNERILYKIG